MTPPKTSTSKEPGTRAPRTKFAASWHPGIAVFKRKDRGGQLYAQWRDPTTGRQQKANLSALGYATKVKAKKWLTEMSERLQKLKSDTLRGVDPLERERKERHETPLTEVLGLYLDEYETRGKRLRQFEESRLRPFKEWIEGKGAIFGYGSQFSSVALAEFYDWLDKRKKRRPETGENTRGKHKVSDEPLSGTAKNTYRRSTVAFFNWARRRGYLSLPQSEITDAFRRYPTDQKRPRYASAERLKDLLHAVVAYDKDRYFGSRDNKSVYTSKPKIPQGELKHSPHGPLVLLLMLTGMRLGEALHLRWENVDFDLSAIRVESDPSADWKIKRRHERDITLDNMPILRRLLLVLKARSGGSKYVIAGDTKNSPKTYDQRCWDDIVKELGLPKITPRLLRSTFETACANAKHGPRSQDLSMLMGHSVTVAEKHYISQTRTREGKTVEEWLGVKKEIEKAMTDLGLTAATSKKARRSS